MKYYRPWYYNPLFWRIFIADWVSKMLVVHFVKYPVWIIPGFLKLNVMYNPGASFGFLAQYGSSIITVLSFLVLAFLAKYTLDRQDENQNVLGETLLLAGGFANFVDRIRSRAVVDFIQVNFGPWHFPTFNLADIVITIGVFIIFYDYVFGEQ